VAATAFSSAGPPYFEAATGLASPYADYLETLDGTLAARSQRGLWAIHVRDALVTAGGISAFPSMHVAVPMIFTLAWWRTRWGWVWAAYTVLTLMGSVRLGWHYAVDGYAAILGAAVIWKVIQLYE